MWNIIFAKKKIAKKIVLENLNFEDRQVTTIGNETNGSSSNRVVTTNSFKRNPRV